MRVIHVPGRGFWRRKTEFHSSIRKAQDTSFMSAESVRKQAEHLSWVTGSKAMVVSGTMDEIVSLARVADIMSL
ncbi:MAG: hypothetical protein BWY99_02228 [Synergistetes bacterium ADurb.BinA166]|nr:MAG: hypothetical protein BWY99_02228 [Synergistetes bacterium ADurb.BinA166]